MELRRHPKLYYSDGDVVLSVTLSSTPSRQLFRVHKAFLSHHSPIFRDMFHLGSMAPIQDNYDNVPLIVMPDDDKAMDMAALLDIIYNPP